MFTRSRGPRAAGTAGDSGRNPPAGRVGGHTPRGAEMLVVSEAQGDS